MLNFIELKNDNGQEIRLEYDVNNNRIYTREEDGSVQFLGLGGNDLPRAIEALKNHFKEMGFKEADSGVYKKERHIDGSKFPLHDETCDFLDCALYGIKKQQELPELTPEEKLHIEKTTKEYFSIANKELPQILAMGFVKAMEKYDRKKSKEICCILDIDSKQSQMVFVYGDGSDCKNTKDESVFFVYPCDDTLKKCKALAGEIKTLNVGQESAHWLSHAMELAKRKGAFKGLSRITVYGDIQYGEYELDVIYER